MILSEKQITPRIIIVVSLVSTSTLVNNSNGCRKVDKSIQMTGSLPNDLLKNNEAASKSMRKTEYPHQSM